VQLGLIQSVWVLSYQVTRHCTIPGLHSLCGPHPSPSYPAPASHSHSCDCDPPSCCHGQVVRRTVSKFEVARLRSLQHVDWSHHGERSQRGGSEYSVRGGTENSMRGGTDYSTRSGRCVGMWRGAGARFCHCHCRSCAAAARSSLAFLVQALGGWNGR